MSPRALARLAVSVLPALILLPVVAGCAVPQPRGGGQLELRGEPTTRRGYWLYLPRQYVQADEQGRSSRRWPVVVSFHGMPPFDGAHAQALEWEQEADRYGFIVVAPRLRSPGVLSSFRSVGSALKSDEEATLRILDDVFATTHADRSNVLSTSWSSGGYVAHYMLNHHPDRFTCLAVRQSNYSESIMDAGRVPESLRHPVLVLAAQHDFGIVKRETRRAIEWYERNQYVNFAWVEIKGLGHERTPDMAAAFFARFAGVEPNEPPAVLARRQAIGGNQRGLALLSGDDRTAESSTAIATARPATPNVQRPAARPSATPSDRTERPATSRAPTAIAASPPPRTMVSIRVSSAIGTDPLVLAFSAECPSDWKRTADFLWTLDGDTVCSGDSGQKTITEPGEHTLGLLVVTASGQEHRAYRLIRVLPHIESTRRPDHSAGR